MLFLQAAGVKAVALRSLGIGASAGVLGSLVGLGGGFVAIPSMTAWLRLTQVRDPIRRRVISGRLYKPLRSDD